MSSRTKQLVDVAQAIYKNSVSPEISETSHNVLLGATLAEDLSKRIEDSAVVGWSVAVEHTEKNDDSFRNGNTQASLSDNCSLQESPNIDYNIAPNTMSSVTPTLVLEGIILPNGFIQTESEIPISIDTDVIMHESSPSAGCTIANDYVLVAKQSVNETGSWPQCSTLEKDSVILEPVSHLPFDNEESCKVSNVSHEVDTDIAVINNHAVTHSIGFAEPGNARVSYVPSSAIESDVEHNFSDNDDEDWLPTNEDVDDSDQDIEAEDQTLKKQNCSSHQSPGEVCKNNTEDKEREVVEVSQKTSRKRKCQPAMWQRNVKKMKVNTGQSYINSSGKTVPARRVKEPCSSKWRLKCSQRISQNERESIFNRFWSHNDINSQRQFVLRSTEIVKPKYCYKKLHTTRGRSQNKAYYFHIGETQQKVCCLFFMNTLCIGDTFLRNIFKRNDANGFIDPDKRGRHGHQLKTDEEILKGIRDHINSIPRIESHYLRSQTTREYIDGSLNMSTLYRIYKESCDQNNKVCGNKHTYRKVFNTEFNISLFVPKKDQCSLSEKYRNSSLEDKTLLQDEYDCHIRNKEMSRIEKQTDVSKSEDDNSQMVAVYDLQAVLPTPNGDISSFYYKSKLNCLNFTVYDIPHKLGYCYFWPENVALRGANEISTCVFMYLKNNCISKNVTFYSDNCCGQNKNKFVACMYLYAVSALDIPSITHKYLITGHSQNEGDSMHSCIEREKKRILKSGPVYVPAQWVPVLRLAKKKGTPYFVQEMDTTDFLDFKHFADEVGNNFTKNTSGEKVGWANMKVLMVQKNTPNVLFYKSDYNEQEFKAIDIKKGYRKKPISQIKLEKAYNTAPGISHEKKDGLLFLCKTNAIKQMFHPFYESLTSQGKKPVATRTRKQK